MFHEYYMARYSTYMLYTFELVFSLVVFFLLLYFYKKNVDKKSIWVYIISGIGHSIVELFAQGSGMRVIKNASLFNVIPLSYPFTAFIIGFFEGGLICLAAYHFTRALTNKDRFSIRFFLFLWIVPFVLIFLGAIAMRIQIESHSSDITLTRRDIFFPIAIIIMSAFYAVSIGYFLLNRKINPRAKLSLLYFYIGLVFYTIIMVLPNHIVGIRYIEVKIGDIYVPANIFEQIIVMYGYDLGLEAGGFLIVYYIIIYRFQLIEVK